MLTPIVSLVTGVGAVLFCYSPAVQTHESVQAFSLDVAMDVAQYEDPSDPICGGCWMFPSSGLGTGVSVQWFWDSGAPTPPDGKPKGSGDCLYIDDDCAAFPCNVWGRLKVRNTSGKDVTVRIKGDSSSKKLDIEDGKDDDYRIVNKDLACKTTEPLVIEVVEKGAGADASPIVTHEFKCDTRAPGGQNNEGN